MRSASSVSLALAAVLLCGCSRFYYASMEKIGREKRDILVSRIVEGKKDQEETREQFKTTLEAFQALTGFEGGDLEKSYKKLAGEYEDAENSANDLRKQIKSIDKVANDLFKEWQKEIDQMENATLKRQSRAMLRNTRSQHEQYMSHMRDTERRMEPVLQAFRDQVLFLKHNLNARAIRSLKTTAAKMDTEVAGLMASMERSMKEADEFIAKLSAPAEAESD